MCAVASGRRDTSASSKASWRAAVVDHRPPLLRARRGRIAGGALGVVVLHGPAEPGAPAVAQQRVVGRPLARARAEIACRLHVHLRRRQRQHHRGLDLARMHAEAVLLGAELRAGLAQRQVEPARAVDDQPMRRAQLARHDLHRAGVPAMGIEEDQLAHARRARRRRRSRARAGSGSRPTGSACRGSSHARGSGRSPGWAGRAPAARPAAAATLRRRCRRPASNPRPAAGAGHAARSRPGAARRPSRPGRARRNRAS